MHEIRQSILMAISNKAPGEDGIPNRILKSIIDLILPYLDVIFNACLTVGYCPAHFRSSITIVLRKPGKPDCTIAKAYRPIALLNTIGKALEFLIAKWITYLAKTHDLLPQNHFGACRSSSTEHTLDYLIERIYAPWNKKKIATALLLDVTGAFDNVSKDRLLHNPRMKKIDPRIVTWIGSFLIDRATILKTNEYTSEKIHISTGIPQGSPLSPILFLFYNSPLLERLNLEPNTAAEGFVDDIAVLVEGNTAEENNIRLLDVHERICKPWAVQQEANLPQKNINLDILHEKERHI